MRESMEIYPRTAAERAMKLQEVLLRATSGKIKWWQAAELIGISERQMRRWRKRYEEQGYQGLLDRRRRKPSSRRVPKEQAEEVLSLYRDKYFDLNVRHFHEKLGEEHQIGLSYTWVKQALQAAGLVKRKARRGVHRKRRERRPLPGMMLHIDGSEHQWFQDERRHDLIVILDDAHQRDLLCAAGAGRNDRHSDGRAARGDRTEGAVLFALFGPWSPFLADAEERWQGRL
jgi:transposase